VTASRAGEPFYFDDSVVGDRHPAGSHTLVSQEIIDFARLWDPQPWHIDEAAAQASHFGGLTACSAHLFAIFCITSQRWQSGVVQQAIAGLGFDEMRIHRPAYAGDTLDCVSIVDSARASASKPDRGIVTNLGQLTNQRGDLVFSVKATTMMRRKPPEGGGPSVCGNVVHGR
jgi:acyl dehydratase